MNREFVTGPTPGDGEYKKVIEVQMFEEKKVFTCTTPEAAKDVIRFKILWSQFLKDCEKELKEIHDDMITKGSCKYTEEFYKVNPDFERLRPGLSHNIVELKEQLNNSKDEGKQ